MIEVVLHFNDREVASAEADDPEAALLAARTLWDDEMRARPLQGVARSLRLLFFVDGTLIRAVEGHRP